MMESWKQISIVLGVIVALGAVWKMAGEAVVFRAEFEQFKRASARAESELVKLAIRQQIDILLLLPTPIDEADQHRRNSEIEYWQTAMRKHSERATQTLFSYEFGRE